MAYPPPLPPATRTNATPMVDNHPGDHNLISAALTEILNHIATMEATLGPIGSVTIWPGTVAPTNYLLCKGQAIIRADYPEIFAIFGTAFGTGDGSTTFNLPDLQGRVPIGVNVGGQPISGGIGEKFGTYDSQVPAHTHPGIDHLHPVNINTSTESVVHQHDIMGIASAGVGGGLGTSIIGGGVVASTTNSENALHIHGVNGFTGGADRSLTTGSTGVAATNLNIQPILSFNFAMRVH